METKFLLFLKKYKEFNIILRISLVFDFVCYWNKPFVEKSSYRFHFITSFQKNLYFLKKSKLIPTQTYANHNFPLKRGHPKGYPDS
ncbi:hypothetical protein CQ056_25655 [Peribacillus simplex]|nr:hypothetical protein CQ056_25655 [Peribacillus simplex]